MSATEYIRWTVCIDSYRGDRPYPTTWFVLATDETQARELALSGARDDDMNLKVKGVLWARKQWSNADD